MKGHEQFVDDLPLYALGALQGAEQDAMEAHLDECGECRRELQRLRGDMALLALTASGPAPPQRARTRLLTAVAKEPRPQAVPARRTWWALAPLLATAVVLAVFVVLLWQQNRGLKHSIEQIQASVSESQAEADRARQVLATLTAPDAVRVTLVSTKSKPQPQGKAIYVPRTGGLVFIASNFATLPPNKAYELWLLPVSGAAPIPAGVFKPDAQGSATVLLPPIAKVEPKAFAITIEPESGSTTPTLPIVLMGAGQ